MASAGPYANHLHLPPDRLQRQYLITQFLQAGCPSCCPTRQSTEGSSTVTVVRPAKTAELIEMSFGLRTQVSEPCIRLGSIFPMGSGNFEGGGKGGPL